MQDMISSAVYLSVITWQRATAKVVRLGYDGCVQAYGNCCVVDSLTSRCLAPPPHNRSAPHNRSVPLSANFVRVA